MRMAWACEHKDRKYHAKGLCRQCYRAAHGIVYRASHREMIQAHYAARKEHYRQCFQAYGAKPERKAISFLRNIDQGNSCTTSQEDIAAIYDQSRDCVTGEVGKTGWGWTDLVLDHVFGGPVVGLMPRWVNAALTERVLENWELFLQYRERHIAALQGQKEAQHAHGN